VTPRGVALSLATLALVLGCSRERASPDAPPPPDPGAASDAFPVLPDSLVLTTPGGDSVWYAGARAGTDSLGAPCVERGLVIVRGASRTLVPLLMTGTAPTLINDTTIRATLWRDCRPGDRYDVNLRTGTPSRVR